jgi:hypothetical protein
MQLITSDLFFVISDVDDTRSSQTSKIHDRSRSANPHRLTAATFPSQSSKATSSDRSHGSLHNYDRGPGATSQDVRTMMPSDT